MGLFSVTFCHFKIDLFTCLLMAGSSLIRRLIAIIILIMMQTSLETLIKLRKCIQSQRAVALSGVVVPSYQLCASPRKLCSRDPLNAVRVVTPPCFMLCATVAWVGKQRKGGLSARAGKSLRMRQPAHLWTICSADFLNVLPRLLFSYYCLAIAAARLVWPTGAAAG